MDDDHYIRAAVREELERKLGPLDSRVDSVERKIERWESNGILLRWIVITLVAVLSQMTGFLKWIREHIV